MRTQYAKKDLTHHNNTKTGLLVKLVSLWNISGFTDCEV